MNFSVSQILIAWALLASLGAWICGDKWLATSRKYEQFKTTVEQQGRQAQLDKAAKEAEQQKTMKEISDGWAKALPVARNNAVAAYIAAHPQRVSVSAPCSGAVPGAADGAQGADGAGQEQLPTCRPDEAFIRDAAEDALKIENWQAWARQNKFPVEQ